ncbi:uncharacterized protein LOC127289418 [Leptopilina boulardi]|uniref:uncharacterized protein LOC127289418 n=1 Tax=Leptopilina boulardi TaxID=63433 RepID=UPI0021F5C676|nr:uncharacterized protein LOC127289418 [Leptopilina boulardi]
MLYNNKVHSPCRCVIIPTGIKHPVSFILQRNSPYTPIMRQIINKFRNFGILERMRQVFKYQIIIQMPNKAKLNILDIAILLAILFCGITFSILTLFLENVYILYQTKKAKVNQNKATVLLKTYTKKKIKKCT